MCGRYKLSRRKQVVGEYFDAVSSEEDWSPRFNIAPTQPIAVIRQNPKEPIRELSLMRWGLIPSWAKDASGAARMINARSETASTKPVFRDSMKSRRCVIPADGFYEWLRREVTRVIVRLVLMTGPAVPSAVPYEVGRFGDELSKSPPTMYPSVEDDGYRNREGPVFLPASRRIGARVNGMVSKCKPL